ncbi:uncharacterized protein LAESUDRAFT_730840 [Laetiporus sulphureus 93-53]|uniref:Uncharacterized protein n=1 Tax=Laetiporus sulphureus 93-53 TaxID=1314785 RepID=A0A165BZD5_9APHY|nr:uncharacterized protein LAESUDRAFT_730840 [Laetiporus sulphureus 93-53]KZT01926.1 hypothetical protein LAESUDRAFT_730840 [Laetiporus sulphureus 93-53]
MFAVLLSLASIVSFVRALPAGHLTAQDTPVWCAGFGPGAFDTGYNFTLAAVNVTLPNANSTGAPLVLGQNGAADGAEFEVLSTYASYPYNDFPTLSLLAGSLIPNSASGIASVDSDVSSGDELAFVTSSSGLSSPAQIYCAIADTDPTEGSPYPVLAVNGDTEGFALCMNGDGPYAQNNVVWQPTDDNGGEYLYDTCYNVTIQLLGLN